MEEPVKKHRTINIPTKILILLIAIIILLLYYIAREETQIGKHSLTETNLTNIEETYNSNTDENKFILPAVTTLSTGTYKVGRDIVPGIYNLKVVSGSGLITGDLQEGYLSEMMGIVEGYEDYYSETYKNLYLKKGDTFEITSGVKIKFVPIT